MGMVGTISSIDMCKLQRHNVGDGKDMINALPDSILHYILSFLPTKDAVRTSILAKKWRYLWTYLSVFDFEIPHGLYESNLQNQESANCLLDLVGRLLHKSNRVERLCIKILKITVDADKVHSLISSAVKNKVHDLTLSIDDLKYLDTRFVLPDSLSASKSLNKLCLQLGFLLYVPDGISFPSLKTLNISCVRFANDESAQRLFSGCPVLEELTLYRCIWEFIKQITIASSTLRMLTIHSDSSCLDYVHFDNCTVKIDAVNLLSLSCTSNPTLEFVLVNGTSIVDAYVHLEYYYPQGELYAAHCAFQLLSGLSSVKSLKLSNDTLECLYYSMDAFHLLPSFHNLTHLYVPSRISDFTSKTLMDIFLKTPKLEVLDIPMAFDLVLGDEEDWTINSVPCCFKSLKLVCISDFFGGEAEIQLVKFFLEKTTVLGEIQLCYSGCLSHDLEKQALVWNQLQPLCLGKCVIKIM